MADEKNSLEALRHTTSDVDFGLEIENISELETQSPLDKQEENDKQVDKEKKDEKKGSDISFSAKEDEDNEDLGELVKKPDHNTTQGTNNTTDDVKFNTLLKTLGTQAKEKNILDFNPEEFEKATDKDQYFTDKLKTTVDTRVTEGIEQGIVAYKTENLPDEINELIDLHKKGVPLYAILESDQNIASIESIATKDIEEDTSLQKTLVTEALKAQGYTKEKIEAKVKRYEDLGSLKDEAIDSKDILLSIEKERKQDIIKQESERKNQAITQRNAKIGEITSTINTRDEILPGFKLTPDDRKTLIDGITKTNYIDKQGRQINALQKARIDDPLHDLKLAYFTLVLKGDVSKIKTKTETQVTNRLKDALDTQDKMGATQHDNTPASTSATKFDRNILRNALKNVR